MGTGGLQLFAHRDIVFQVILGAVGVKDIAGIANRAFADLAVINHSVHRHAHVFNPVQAVEHAEDIHTFGRGDAHEFLHDVVGVIGIAHAVRPAQQHLGHHVGNCGAQVAQALPRAFLQKPVCHVECRTAPAFHRE